MKLDKLLTDKIIKIVFGKISYMEPHVRGLVENLVICAFLLGTMAGILICALGVIVIDFLT